MAYGSFWGGCHLIELDKETGLAKTPDDIGICLARRPKWMDGARAGAIIPLTLFKKANIKWVIPSDLNLINGVINDLK